MSLIDHPVTAKIMRFGYPEKERFYGTDNLKNDVMAGDEILVLGERFYLASVLGSHATEILLDLGATYHFAE